MSANKEIKYDVADSVKLNDEVNVNLEDQHHDGVGSTPGGLCGSSSLKGSAERGANTVSYTHLTLPTTPYV